MGRRFGFKLPSRVDCLRLSQLQIFKAPQVVLKSTLGSLAKHIGQSSAGRQWNVHEYHTPVLTIKGLNPKSQTEGNQPGCFSLTRFGIRIHRREWGVLQTPNTPASTIAGRVNNSNYLDLPHVRLKVLLFSGVLFSNTD